MAILIKLRAISFLTLAAAASAAPSPRTRASFDFGWRFHLGDVAPAGPCNSSAFPVNVSGVQCLNLQEVPAGSASAADCEQACCAAGHACGVWQWRSGTGCWTGSDCADEGPDPNGWVGGARSSTPANKTCPPGPGSPCSASYDDSAWRSLNVPHDYVIEGDVSESENPDRGALARNTSWYRKHFALDPSLGDGRPIWLTFDGVFREADVYVNGAFLLHHEEGYTPFIAFIHNASVPLAFGGDNVIAVYIDGTQAELWCYEGAGIYRHVWLESAAPLSFAPWSFSAPSYVDGAISGADAEAPQTSDSAVWMPQADLCNAGPARAIGSVLFTLADPSGAVVASASVRFNLSALSGFARVTANVPFGSAASPVALWNVNPNGPPLYSASATATLDGDASASDSVSERVGVRSAVFDARRGFLLNGVQVKIKGTSNHVGFGGVGMAVPDRVAEFEVATLRAAGVNAWRTAHNPVAPELLDAADAYGMLVWSENRFVQRGVQPVASLRRGGSWPARTALGADPAPPSVPAADAQLVADAVDMVLRFRNHPSIILWSLCNELGCAADSPTGDSLAVQFKTAMYKADKSRPITGNTVQRPYLDHEDVDPFAEAMDVQSFSYEYDAYVSYHEAAPWKAVGGGESGSCVVDRGVFGAASSGHLGPDDRGLFECVSEGWSAAGTLPYVFGNFLWTGFDYYGETYPTGWPAISSHFGAFDLCGFPKVGVSFYEAWWRDYPRGCSGANVHVGVSPDDWTAPVASGATVDVHVTTCAASVTLAVNGEVVAPANAPVPIFGSVTFPKVPFAPGNITVTAFDASGAVVASRSVVSAGVPFALRAWVEDSFLPPRNGSHIAADGQDAALIGVELVDANGVRVPNADVNVTFAIAGPASLVGVHNGDPADHSHPKSSWRLTFHGLARAIVASSGGAGGIVVTAAAPGLQPGNVRLVAS